MNALTWTTDLPSEPGYYWQRWVGEDYASAPRLLEVLQLRDGLHACHGTSVWPLPELVEGLTHEWAGPINPPS